MSKKNLKAAGTKSRPFFIGETVRLRIERLAYHSGHGVGRVEGFVVFVPFTAPEDEVEARITRLQPSFAEAELSKLITPGASRRAPVCPVAGHCGGCHWQHVNYQEQIIQKQNILKHALGRLTPQLELRPLVPSVKEFRYRNRVQVHHQGSRLGYFAAGTNDLIDIHDCHITEEVVTSHFAEIRARPAAKMERIEIARRPDGKVTVRESDRDPEAGQFAQVNESQNQELIRLLLEATRPFRGNQIVDLYCGSGNLTFPLAEAFPTAHISGVELSRVLVEAAKFRANHLPRQSTIEWFSQSTNDFLKKFQPRSPDWLLVLDPPRPGCDVATRETILARRPRQIVYVSCNPSTLARDLDPWLKSGIYRLESAQGLDMFPQTAHLEAVVSLIAQGP